MKRKIPRGFTLIELLTVIAIIGILAAILIPVTATVRRQASSAKCVSNLRQLGFAAQQHAQDFRGRMPDSKRWQYLPQTQGSIGSYLAMPQGWAPGMPTVFRCDTCHDIQASTNGNERTYSMNRFASGSTDNEFDPSINMPAGAAFSMPSRTAVFMDGAVGASGGVYWSSVTHAEIRTTSAAQPLYSHGGAINVVFADAHVERVTKEKMVSEQSVSSNTSFWRYNR